MDYPDPIATDFLVTVVETPEFIARADKLLTADEHDGLIAYLAANPTSGDLVPGAGGIRKLRWALAGRGKRGRAGGSLLSQPRAANEFRQLTKILVETYRRPTR